MEATQTNVLSADISQPGTHTHNRTEAEATNELLGPLAACRSFLLLSKESAWVVRVGGERERRMKSGRLNGFYYMDHEITSGHFMLNGGGEQGTGEIENRKPKVLRKHTHVVVVVNGGGCGWWPLHSKCCWAIYMPIHIKW